MYSTRLLPLLLLGLAACSDTDGLGQAPAPTPPPAADTTAVAVVALRASDFSSGAHALIDLADNSSNQNLDPDGSDLSIRADGDQFFRVGRLFGGSDANAISLYSLDNPGLALSTYSTQDAANPDQGSNPYDIIRVSPERAYVLRYGASAAWIVDPEASSEGGFKQGEIDLSAFDSDGVPDMVAGVRAAGRVWVLLQRLEFFDSTSDSLLVAIDIASNSLVDLDPATAEIDGLPLPLRNATQISVSNDGGSLYVLAQGGSDFDANFNATPRYDGGLAEVSLVNLSERMLLDDGEAGAAPYGQFTHFAQDANDALWLVAGDLDFGGTDSLYAIDPVSGTASAERLPAATSDIEISTLAPSPEGDLWLGLAGNSSGILRLDPSTGITTTIPLELVPINIDFADTRG